MDVHEAAWPRQSSESMTGIPGDAGVTESQNDQIQLPIAQDQDQDQDWADMISSCLQNSGIPSTCNNMEFDMFGNVDDGQAQFGATNDFFDDDPASATTNSSLSSSVCDPNGAPRPFHTWGEPPSGHMVDFEHFRPPVQAGPWMPEQHFEPQPAHFGMQYAEGLGIHMPPTSHPFDQPIPMHITRGFVGPHSPVYQHEIRHAGPWDRPERSVPPHDELFVDEDDREGTDQADPCYAQLLYQCLKEAPDYTLSLRELYDWVAQHSQKAKDPKNRGWQNSVRHNLSMNAAFARVPHGVGNGPKKGSLWRLTEDALREGVISTTRYRKDPKRKPDRRNNAPALNRQASGAKGGRATRDATRFRQQQQNRSMHGLSRNGATYRRGDRNYYGMQYSPYSRSVEGSPQPGFVPPTPAGSPYFLDDPASLPLPLSAPQTPPGQYPLSSTPPPSFQVTFDQGTHRKPSYTNFHYLPLEQTHGIFGDHDPEMQHAQQLHHQHHYHHPDTPTPSLMTESSFMTDDNMQNSCMPLGIPMMGREEIGENPPY